RHAACLAVNLPRVGQAGCVLDLAGSKVGGLHDAAIVHGLFYGLDLRVIQVANSPPLFAIERFDAAIFVVYPPRFNMAATIIVVCCQVSACGNVQLYSTAHVLEVMLFSASRKNT